MCPCWNVVIITGGNLKAKPVPNFIFLPDCLYAGKPEGVLIQGVKASARQYNIQVDALSSAESKIKFPQFHIPADFEILFEPDAGLLTPERCILSFTEQATKAGATIHAQEQLIAWKEEQGGVTVTTNKNTYTCAKLILTTGAWTAHVAPEFQKQLKVTRQVLAWAIPQHGDSFTRWENFRVG
jgi:sarcosine oxidase